MKKVLGIFIGVLCALLVFGFIGSAWNIAATKSELASFPPEGKLVNVLDTQMHVYTRGRRRAGKPAIVMISGLATPSPVADYYPLWSRLESENFVVVLERPGYGWSGTTSRERTIENLVLEDRIALRNAGIEAPFVLVAHSTGGLEAAFFAAEYENDVTGMVLIDCMSPEAYLKDPPSEKLPTGNKLVPKLQSLGIMRLVGTLKPSSITKRSWKQRNGFEYVSEHYQQIDLMFYMQKAYNKLVNEETLMQLQNATFVNDFPIPQSIPVRLAMVDHSTEEEEENKAYLEYVAMQQRWAEQSKDGKSYLFVGGSYLHHYVPDKICELIEDII